jgi:hypothetical protein
VTDTDSTRPEGACPTCGHIDEPYHIPLVTFPANSEEAYAALEHIARGIQAPTTRLVPKDAA